MDGIEIFKWFMIMCFLIAYPHAAVAAGIMTVVLAWINPIEPYNLTYSGIWLTFMCIGYFICHPRLWVIFGIGYYMGSRGGKK